MSQRIKNRVDVFMGVDLKKQVILFAQQQELTQSGAVKHMVKYFFQHNGHSEPEQPKVKNQPKLKIHPFTREKANPQPKVSDLPKSLKWLIKDFDEYKERVLRLEDQLARIL